MTASRQDPAGRAVYRITVQGILDERWCASFDQLTITAETTPPGPPLTTLTGAVADQAELRGILNRLWNLNLTLLSAIRVEPAGAGLVPAEGGEGNGKSVEHVVA